MAQKKVLESSDGALVSMARSIGATVGTVAGALGITPEKSTVPEVAKPVKKTMGRAPRPKKAANKVVKASKSSSKKAGPK